MQENAILVLSDNLVTFSVILKATSQDFTWCQKRDKPSNVYLNSWSAMFSKRLGGLKLTGKVEAFSATRGIDVQWPALQ